MTDLSPEDIFGLEFGDESEAWDFYVACARCHVYVARKDLIGRDLKGNINM